MIGKMDYATCQAQCAAGGMMMPCLKSAEDEAALMDAYNGTLTVWIGLDDLETQGTYEWQAAPAPTGNGRLKTRPTSTEAATARARDLAPRARGTDASIPSGRAGTDGCADAD